MQRARGEDDEQRPSRRSWLDDGGAAAERTPVRQDDELKTPQAPSKPPRAPSRIPYPSPTPVVVPPVAMPRTGD